MNKNDRDIWMILKKEKAKAELACTRSRRQLLKLVNLDLPSRRQIRNALQLQEIDTVQQEALNIIEKMYQSSKKIHSTYEESHTGDGVY